MEKSSQLTNRTNLINRRKILVGTLLLSLGLHILIFWSTLKIQIPTVTPSQAVDLIYTEDLQELLDNKNGSLITSTDLPSNLLDMSSEEQARFLSEFKQRVQSQTQAALTGATKNRSHSEDNLISRPNISPPSTGKSSPENSTGASTNPEIAQNKKLSDHFKKKFIPQYDRKISQIDIDDPESSEKESSLEKTKTSTKTQTSASTGLASTDLASKNQGNDSPSIHSPAFLEKGLSTVGESLPVDIDIGSFTALNADRHMFYTFYSRINEMIRFRWESAVHATINQSIPQNFKYNPLGVWTTHLEVILRSTGEIEKILLLKPSGNKGFDDSAIYSFKDSKAFYNPPRELISPDDGRIHLKYSFQVHYEPKVLVKSR